MSIHYYFATFSITKGSIYFHCIGASRETFTISSFLFAPQRWKLPSGEGVVKIHELFGVGSECHDGVEKTKVIGTRSFVPLSHSGGEFGVNKCVIQRGRDIL